MLDIWELKQWHEQQKEDAGCGRTLRARATAAAEPAAIPSAREYLPTPEEIRQECLAIQMEWTDAERRRRGGAPRRTEPRADRQPTALLFG